MASSFVPKGQEGLLLRSPLTFGFFPSASSHERKPIYSKHFDKSHMLGDKQRDILSAGAQPHQKIGFYTRHNPHPARVRHFKGLNDVPICYVEDMSHERYLVSPPSGQDYGPGYRPPGNMRYSAQSERRFPAVGIVPVTYAWRDELEKKASNAINRAMGHQSRMGMVSANGPRLPGQFDHLADDKLLDILCRILQTDSVPVCQAWLSSASDSEKNIVLNMIRMAATGELGTNQATRPQTSDSHDLQYVWAPSKSQTRKPQHEYSYLSDDDDFEFSQNGHLNRETETGERDHEGDPFKFPEHDTVIKTARQLSTLASRQSSRGHRGMDPGWSFQYNALKAPAGETDEERLAKIAAQLARSRSQQSHSGRGGQHVRSASLSGPTLTGNRKTSSRRSRSKSANAPVKMLTDSSYPPPPVKVHVTKETVRSNTAGSSSSKAQLRYTSHWDS